MPRRGPRWRPKSHVQDGSSVRRNEAISLRVIISDWVRSETPPPPGRRPTAVPVVCASMDAEGDGKPRSCSRSASRRRATPLVPGHAGLEDELLLKVPPARSLSPLPARADEPGHHSLRENLSEHPAPGNAAPRARPVERRPVNAMISRTARPPHDLGVPRRRDDDRVDGSPRRRGSRHLLERARGRAGALPDHPR